jgi:hypothetical protein
MATGVFATAITCIDGRTQSPVSEWVKRNAHADFVDTVTWAGPDGALTSANPAILDHIRQMVEISVRAHGSSFIAIAGHHDCAAFIADRERHITAVREAITIIAGWGLSARVTGLWVNDQWQIEVVGYGGAIGG